MKLTSLKLTQFRNFSNRIFEFADSVVVVGRNGVGKTNLIESIRLLSLMKSFRARTDQEAIQFEQVFFRVEGGVVDDTKHTVALYLGKDEGGKLTKQVKLDGAAKRLTEAIGFIKTVLFTADELNLVGGVPQRRRHFLDFLLSQLDYKYLFDLSEYKRALRQRGELLNWIKLRQASAEDLETWDGPLVEHGQYILGKRQELAAFFNQILPKEIRFEAKFTPLTAEALHSSRQRDIQFGATTVGPHRDDFELLLNGRSLQKYGSRGEWRRAVTLLKVAEAEYIFYVSGKQPLLLADDLFSELDLGNRGLVEFHNIGQSIYTTPEVNLIPESLKKQAQVIELTV